MYVNTFVYVCKYVIVYVYIMLFIFFLVNKSVPLLPLNLKKKLNDSFSQWSN